MADLNQRQTQFELQMSQTVKQMQQLAQAQKDFLDFKFKKLEMMIFAKQNE